MPCGLRFSRAFATFSEWLSSHLGGSGYTSRISRTHARYPSATLSQLRRHPRTGLAKLSQLLRAPPSRLPQTLLSQNERTRRQRALSILSEVRRGKGSLSKLARVEGISPRTVRRATGAFRKRGARWVATRRDRIQRWLKSYENGRRFDVLIDDSRTATLLSKYAHAVNEYLVKRDPAVFAPFEGKTYRDASGVEHTFETDPNAIVAAVEASESDFSAFVDLYSESDGEEEGEV